VQEFVARHCPEGVPIVSVELRLGLPGEQIPDVAAEVGADMIALGWAQDLSPGHAAVVQRVLGATKVPVLLLPVASRIEQKLGA